MKIGTLFWGSLLIFLGIFILLDNLNLLSFELNNLLSFWPILLILWGILLLKIPNIFKLILSAISGIILALLIISTFYSIKNSIFSVNIKDTFANNSSNSNNSIDVIEMDSVIKYVNLEISTGASSFNISKNSDNTNLITTFTEGILVEDNSELDSIKNIKVSAGPLENKKTDYMADLSLNNLPIYKIELNAGASKIDCNFSNIKIKKIDIDAGAANIRLRLGSDMDTTFIKINSGISKINLLLPKESKCILKSESSLSANNFKSFKKMENGKYEYYPTINNAKVIIIDFEGALSSFSIANY